MQAQAEQPPRNPLVNDSLLSLAGRRILMVAPCLGKFGGIEAFCLALAEDLLSKDAEVTILRKKVAGFAPNNSI